MRAHRFALPIVSCLPLLAWGCNAKVDAPPTTPVAVDAGVLVPDQMRAQMVKSLPWPVETVLATWKEGLSLAYQLDIAPVSCTTTVRVVGCTNDECAIEVDRSACAPPGQPPPAKMIQKLKLGVAVLAGATLPLGTRSADWRPVPCPVLGAQPPADAACLQVESRATGAAAGELEVLRTVVGARVPVVVEHFAGIERDGKETPVVTLKLKSLTGP